MAAAMRGDHRADHQFRIPLMNLGVVSHARGSAYVELGPRSKVLCSVSGPRPLLQGSEFSDVGRLRCEFRHASFATSSSSCGSSVSKRAFGGASSSDRECAALIEEALEISVILDRFPKSQVDVQVVVLESSGDGDDVAMAITGASLALCDAGIELFDLVAACTVCETTEGRLLADPVGSELAESQGTLSVAAMVAFGDVTHLLQAGVMEPQTLQLGVELALQGCARIRSAMDACLCRKYLQDVPAAASTTDAAAATVRPL